MLVVRKDSPFKSVADVIEYAKRNPEKLNYATLGPGSGTHVAGELFQKAADVKLTPISYKGTAPALTDLLSGVLDVAFDFYSIMRPHIDADNIRVLAVEAPERMPALPGVPTFVELGYPDAIYPTWSVFVAPAGTPDNVVKKLSMALDETLRDKRVEKYFKELSVQLLQGHTGKKLEEFIGVQRTRIKATIEAAGIAPDK